MPSDDRLGFIEWLHGGTPGFVAVGIKTATTGHWLEKSFPSSDHDGIAERISKYTNTSNIYFCPTRLTTRQRIKDSVVFGQCLWADLDECPPEVLRVKPSIVVETSPGRYQAYWKLKRISHAIDIENYNRRIAYHHEKDGCDISGWDLTQMMRIPSTLNFKYVDTIGPCKVVISELNSELLYDLSDFEEAYPELERFKGLSPDPLPLPENLPNKTGKELLEELTNTIHPRVWRLFKDTPLEDWSSNIWALQLMLFELSVPKEHVFVIARDAACNKFSRDGHDNLILWREVLRAEASVKRGGNPKLAASNDRVVIPDRELLTEDERNSAKADITVVDDYIAWASSVCDAPPQYHVAGAFIILTGLLSGHIRLPTSFATLVPNLWFMILAETTLTRKSTAMDLATDLITDIDGSVIMATDGTVEGILEAMTVRPNMPSMFVRDEFSGLLEAMGKKDYLSGMLEGFTKLYDGKLYKRALRKETVEVRDPIFILFAGGIRSRILSLVGHHHVMSGFLPRFCFVTAEADFNRIKPLGPPTIETSSARDALLIRFKDIKVANTPSLKSEILFESRYNLATLTPDAWRRFNEIDEVIQNIGFNSSMEDMLTPMMARLAISGLKAAVLVAASRNTLPDANIVVEERDIIKAFSFVEQWKQHAIQVVMNAGKSPMEKNIEQIYEFIGTFGVDGVSRPNVMNKFRITAKDANNIFETLNQRGLVEVFKRSGTTIYVQKEFAV